MQTDFYCDRCCITGPFFRFFIINNFILLSIYYCRLHHISRNGPYRAAKRGAALQSFRREKSQPWPESTICSVQSSSTATRITEESDTDKLIIRNWPAVWIDFFRWVTALSSRKHQILHDYWRKLTWSMVSTWMGTGTVLLSFWCCGSNTQKSPERRSNVSNISCLYILFKKAT